jgi:hypothetical protein
VRVGIFANNFQGRRFVIVVVHQRTPMTWRRGVLVFCALRLDAKGSVIALPEMLQFASH